MEKILVLMATYNGEKYIEEQLESLFAQEGVEVALLVRDDGSTDRTREILDAWSQKASVRWYAEGHLGAKYGFLELVGKGLSSDADYFAFCDQDDVWDPDKLQIALSHLQTADPAKPALYYCGQTLVDENLEPLSVHRLNAKRTLPARFVFGDIAGCTGVFNRALAEAMASYKPEYMRMHDLWTMKVCCALGGQVFVDPEPHLAYRQHGNNVEGLSNSLRSKVTRFVRYCRHDITAHMAQLKKGYGDRLCDEYRRLIDRILLCREKPSSRWALLKQYNIDFCNKGIALAFFLKILFNKI